MPNPLPDVRRWNSQLRDGTGMLVVNSAPGARALLPWARRSLLNITMTPDRDRHPTMAEITARGRTCQMGHRACCGFQGALHLIYRGAPKAYERFLPNIKHQFFKQNVAMSL
jgi:hypothetical protein